MPVVTNVPSASERGTHSSLVAAFRRPPDEYGPNPAWWWTGERLTVERLEWQMRQFHAGGLRQVTVISLAPHSPAHDFPADDPPFYSDEWWVCFRHVASIALELAMKLWYFDHIGVFPTRFARDIIERHPDFRARELTRARAGTALPPGAEVLDDRDGYVYYSAPIAVFDHYAAPTFHDLYNPAAGAALIDAIHGEMERRLGDRFPVIGGSFQDELRPLPSWAQDLPGAFRERTGRDLVDCLPALFDTTIDDPPPDPRITRVWRASPSGPSSGRCTTGTPNAGFSSSAISFSAPAPVIPWPAPWPTRTTPVPIAGSMVSGTITTVR